MAGDGLEPEGIDVERANAARMYDYFLGGAHNFAVDRELGDRALAAYPAGRAWARGNRHFLMRAVQYCVERGVHQFLDLGSGIPTADHVHSTARALVPGVRVAYVDLEPVAVAHSEELLGGVEGVTVTRADVRDPAAVLGAPGVAGLLDFTEPVAVLAVAILHFVSDADDPEAVLDGYRRALVPGSCLALTHSSTDYPDDPELGRTIAAGAAVYGGSANPQTLRARDRILGLFGGLPLVEPGLVDIARWRSGDPSARQLGSYAGLSVVPR